MIVVRRHLQINTENYTNSNQLRKMTWVLGVFNTPLDQCFINLLLNVVLDTLVVLNGLDSFPYVEPTKNRSDKSSNHPCPLYFQYQIVGSCNKNHNIYIDMPWVPKLYDSYHGWIFQGVKILSTVPQEETLNTRVPCHRFLWHINL